MATIVTRSGKGSALTIAELDANFNNLNTGKLEEALTRASVRPTLLLDFAKSKTLDPRVTFTRASTATYYDGKTVAMAEQNLLTYSQDFTQSVWVKANCSVTSNFAVAPDGTNTASRLLATGASADLAQIIGTGTYTQSIYVKSNTGSNQTVSLWTGFATIDFTATPSGWTRISSSQNSKFDLFIAASGTDILIWGAQLEQRTSVTAYTPTTTAAITNYIPQLLTAAANVPRFDCNPTTGESLGLLIEEQRTNLLLYSSDFDNAFWTKNAGTTVSANANVAPDGTITADRIIPASNGTTNGIRPIPISISSGQTISWYAKQGEISAITGQSGLGDVFTFNLASGTRSVDARFTNSSMVNVGNGWYRCSLTYSASNGTNFFLGSDSGANSYNGFFIWGAQLEQGAFPTSYIPTVASTVTRNADFVSIGNVSSFVNTSQGTYFSEFSVNFFGSSSRVIGLNGGAAAPIVAGSGRNIQSFDGSNTITTANSISGTNTVARAAGAYDNTTKYAVLNGGSVVSAARSSTFPYTPTTSIQIGSENNNANVLNGYVRRVAYYPQLLTNAQLQAITTP